MIDVGKSFLPAATEWFPKYGLRHIDAVLITHAHADGTFGFWAELYAHIVSLHVVFECAFLAMNGLDDLRGEFVRFPSYWITAHL